MVNKIASGFFFLLILACNTQENNSEQETEKRQVLLHSEFLNKGICGDVLNEFGMELDTSLFQFVSCTPDTLSGQTEYEALYQVKGENINKAEAYLMKVYEMDSLHFVCCGWEDKTGKYIHFGDEEIDGEVVSFIGRFSSEETLINNRENWDSIPSFNLAVKVAKI